SVLHAVSWPRGLPAARAGALVRQQLSLPPARTRREHRLRAEFGGRTRRVRACEGRGYRAAAGGARPGLAAAAVEGRTDVDEGGFPHPRPARRTAPRIREALRATRPRRRHLRAARRAVVHRGPQRGGARSPRAYLRRALARSAASASARDRPVRASR